MRDNENHNLLISGEANSLRSEFSKHYRVSDGTFAALSYARPVHFPASDGSFTEIINKLEKTEKEYTIQA